MPEPTQSIRIHPAAPAKPAWGAECNGCGVCCAAEPCPLGVLVTGRRQGACRALRWNAAQGRYRCGLMAAPLVGAAVKRLISAGRGCDSDAQVLD